MDSPSSWRPHPHARGPPIAQAPKPATDSSSPVVPSSRWRMARPLFAAAPLPARATARPREDEVQVAEGPPGEAMLQRRAVGEPERLQPCDGLQQAQVRAARLVPAGEQPVHDPDAALR